MYTKPKTKQEKEFLESVIDFIESSSWLADTYGSHCQSYRNYEIHHIKGAQTKVKTEIGTIKIGEYYILPIPFEFHNIKSNHKLNITNRKKEFERVVGEQKQLYLSMLTRMLDLGYRGLPDNVELAIKHV